MAVDGHTLEFCLAEEADFEEVMSISGDVYGGIDYLPVRYHAWIRDPFRRVILAKKKGQIVSPFCKIFDQGFVPDVSFSGPGSNLGLILPIIQGMSVSLARPSICPIPKCPEGSQGSNHIGGCIESRAGQI
eukprot:g36931.t1